MIKAMFSRLDKPLIASATLLSVWGLLAIYSASLYHQNFNDFYKQLLFLILGLILMTGISFFDYRKLKSNSYVVLTVYLIPLIGLMGLFLMPAIRGSRRWYALGPINFDPMPFMALGLIIILAKFLSQRHSELHRFQYLLLSGFYAFWPVLFIFLQPNFGGATIFFLLWFGIILFSGIKTSHLLALLIGLFLIGSMLWSFGLEDYQQQRIISFLGWQDDPLGASWNVDQSRVAIGSGQVVGRGLLAGSQAKYGFLPEAKTDFIFAIMAEETGFIGVLAIFGLFILLIWRLIKICFRSINNFGQLYCVGFIVFLTASIFINVGMNLGLLPVVGLPLPFVSYGGSYLIALYVGLGLALSIRQHG